MALQIGPKNIAGIVIYYNLIKDKLVPDCIIYISYYILAYVQHKGDVSFANSKDRCLFWDPYKTLKAKPAPCRIFEY